MKTSHHSTMAECSVLNENISGEAGKAPHKQQHGSPGEKILSAAPKKNEA